MCGIAGIISSDPSLVNAPQLNRMMTALAHRGPDGEGYWINLSGNVGFGHRRLSIIDLTKMGDQPMHYQNRYTIIYNGEIYNYIELRESLIKLGETFNSHSDTEVILAMYARYKEKCLIYFDGMFAFAIWDQEEQKLFAARDRFGEKPFYYHWDPATNTLAFASEMKALWAIGVPKKVEDTMLLPFISSGFTHNPGKPALTFYSGIKKIPARNYLTYQFSQHKIHTHIYWELDRQINNEIEVSHAQQKFSELLYTSVSRRLRSDVSVGTSLSGGIDSSTISAIINQITSSGKQPETGYDHVSFSAVFKGYEKDESGFINIVSTKFNLKNYQVTPGVTDLIADLGKLNYYQEEPFPSSSTYAQYKVFELAQQKGIKVLLDGQGADEILGGYSKYHHWYWQELLRKKRFIQLKSEQIKTTPGSKEIKWGYKNYLAAIFPGAASTELSRRAFKLQQLHPDINEEYLRSNLDKSFFIKPVVKSLDDILYFNTFHTGLEELLTYADRNSMAHGREVRLPFLNHELVQFVFSLPSNFKIRQGFTKWILRKTMENILPPEIVWRREKIGFEPPQKKWMTDKILSDYIQEAKKKLVSKGILKPSVLDKKVVPNNAYEDGYDWRYLSAAQIL
jgi:asparagine synthase (glutamine-hydrolysing)